VEDTSRVSAELVALLGLLADLSIPASSRTLLAKALEEHISALRHFSLSDLAETDPAITFDPRWT
jgi:hypothetical protein